MSNQRKSIRLEIDLPIDLTCTDASLVEETSEDFVHTIRLKISIDKHSKKSQLNESFGDSSSSGYSSSGSSIYGSSSNAILSKTFSLSNLQTNQSYDSFKYVSKPLDKQENENVYDKLSNNFNRNLKYSSSLSSKLVKQRSLQSFSSNAKLPRYEEENIYEDLTSFLEPKEPYSKPSNPRRVNLKREYTVNEIFDNLEYFEQEALEQEILNSQDNFNVSNIRNGKETQLELDNYEISNPVVV